MSKKLIMAKKCCYELRLCKKVLSYRQYYLGWSFWRAVCLSTLGTSLNPFASNQGALAQSKPSPNVLSGAAIYQWQEESGTSTAHFDQSSDHWGTCTQRIEDNKNESILLIKNIIYDNLDL